MCHPKSRSSVVKLLEKNGPMLILNFFFLPRSVEDFFFHWQTIHICGFLSSGIECNEHIQAKNRSANFPISSQVFFSTPFMRMKLWIVSYSNRLPSSRVLEFWSRKKFPRCRCLSILQQKTFVLQKINLSSFSWTP